MKTLVTACLSALTLTAMTACGNKAATQDTEQSSQPKTLVLYYSQTGATKAVAEQIKNVTGGDIEQIIPLQPYDGTYDETINRCIAEMQAQTAPEIQPLQSNINDYDVVFVGYPIWFGTYARPILGLIDAYDFKDVNVVPFCTFGSGGLEASVSDLREALPDAKIADGYGVRNARIDAMPDEIDYFLKSNGYIEGETTQLPEFGETQPVNEDDVAIFDAACGDYQFPLGTPISVASRQYDDTVEYKYSVESKSMDGTPAKSTIYVIVNKDSRPVFTKVVR